MMLDPPAPAGAAALPPPVPGDLGRTPPLPSGRPHRGARRAVLVVGGLVTALLIVQGTLALVGLWFRTSDTAPLVLGGGRITDVVVEVDAGTVRLVPGEVFDGRRTAHYGLVKPRLTVMRDGGSLAVTGHCGRVWLSGSWCSTDVTLTVPADVRVRVHTAAGDVHIGAITGEVRVSSGAGDVNLTGTTGPVVVETGAGDVRGVDLGPVVDAQSGAGDVRLAFAVAPTDVRAESGAGDVAVLLPPGETVYRVDADSGAGSRTVDVRTSPTATARVFAQSGAGNVSVRYAS